MQFCLLLYYRYDPVCVVLVQARLIDFAIVCGGIPEFNEKVDYIFIIR